MIFGTSSPIPPRFFLQIASLRKKQLTVFFNSDIIFPI